MLNPSFAKASAGRQVQHDDVVNRALILSVTQILISLLLVGMILLQAKGVGLSATFGGEGGFYHTKRGVEKVLFAATIVLAVVFVVLSLLGSVI